MRKCHREAEGILIPPGGPLHTHTRIASAEQGRSGSWCKEAVTSGTGGGASPRLRRTNPDRELVGIYGREPEKSKSKLFYFSTFRTFRICYSLFDFSTFRTFRLFEFQNTFRLFDFSTFRTFRLFDFLNTFRLFELFDFSTFRTFRFFELRNTVRLFEFRNTLGVSGQVPHINCFP